MIQTLFISLLIFLLAADAFIEHGPSAWRRLFPRRDMNEKLEPKLRRRFLIFRFLNMIAGLVGMMAAILIMAWVLTADLQIHMPVWVSVFFLIVAFVGSIRLFSGSKIDADAYMAKELNLTWLTLSIDAYKRIIRALGIGCLLVGFFMLIALVS